MKSMPVSANPGNPIAEIEAKGGQVWSVDAARKPQRWAVSFRGCNVADGDLACLAGLPGLQILDVSSTPITDAGLVDLVGMASLENLPLGQSKITDAGLAALTGLPVLRCT